MTPVEAHMRIYSPRTGKEYDYNTSFEDGSLVIERNQHTAKLIWNGYDADPTWEDRGRGLLGIMANEHIYPPCDIKDRLKRLWLEWREGRIESDDLQPELDALADYINTSTKAKPKTPFWAKHF